MNTWRTISQVKREMADDLVVCHTDFEREMVKAMAGEEIREMASQLASTGKLSHAEAAIAREFGYKG